MKNIRSIVLALLAITALAACNKSSSSDKSTGDGTDGKPQADNNAKSGLCGLDVVSDYNKVMLNCKFAKSADSLKNCRSMTQSFLDKYPGVNCEAETQSETSVNKEKFQISEEKLKKVVKTIDEAGL